MSDIEREAFEKRFPVPAGIYWNDISEQYDALPGAAGFDDVEIYHGQWMGWQAARQAPASGEVEPFAWVSEAEETEQLIGGRPRKLWWECNPGVGTPVFTHPPAKVPEKAIQRLRNIQFAVRHEVDGTKESRWRVQDMANEVINLLTTPTPATTPQPAQQGSVPDVARELIQTVLERAEQWERGEKLPDDHQDWIDRAKALLSATPQPEGDGWVKCSERLPTEADEDAEGNVWARVAAHNEVSALPPSIVKVFSEDGKITHWAPTGLKRPQPPVEQEGAPRHRSSEQ